MDLEASVVERLQKLRQWQLEQQERLLKQQQIQREMLTQKQDSMYKALELSIQELDLNEDALNINNSNKAIKITDNNKNLITLHDESEIQVINNNELSVNQNINNSFENIISQQHSPRKKFIEDAINIENHIKRHPKDKIMSNVKDKINLIISPKEEKQIKQFTTDGIAPLPPDKIVINHICIDDIPILSPKKDFHTLLEEKLKNSENEPSEKSIASSENKVKKPFLKKGEGLTRFKLNQHKQLTTSKARSHTALFTSNTRFGSKCSKNKNKSNKTTKCLKNAQLSKGTHCTSIEQKHLCLQNIPLPKKKVCSKSDSNTSTIYLKDYVNEMKNTIELNTPDFHSGTQKELEEVRIFELLEEKAENSSFCSTSSAVIAFLQQSTPFKVKNAGYRTENNMCSIKQVTPINKILKEQSVLKSNKCMKSSKDTGTHCDFLGFMNQKIIHDNEMLLQDKENNTTDANGNKYMLLKDQIQSTCDKQNFCDALAIEDDNEVDVSLHVRFSEYNEYKTIGLTDTSSISTESLVTTNFSDEKAWSDFSTPEISTIDSSIPFKIPQSCVIMKNKMQKLNYETQSCQNIKQNKSTCNTDIHQYKDELELSNIEDQTSNNEMSSLCKYNENDSTSRKSDNSCNIETFKKYTKKYENGKESECGNNYNDVIVTEDQENKKELQETNGSIFKSELLKNRLLELEQEISIFRKENAALSTQRKKLHEDYKNICKEYAQKEKSFEENRKHVEECLQEERKKLAREKAALENRMRDSQEKAQQSKLERQEIQNLKQEIVKLTEEMHIKESRWNAAQSRHKCQMRILKMENSKLKQEIERLQNLKKNNVRNKVKCGSSTNTRAIHQINKQLNMQFKKSHKMNDALLDDDQKLVESMLETMDTVNSHTIAEAKEDNYNDNNNIMNDKSQKSQTMVDVVKKRNLYENLIKEATLDLTEIQEQFNTSENLSESKSILNSKLKILDSKTNVIKDNCEKSYKEGDIPSNHNSTDDNIQLYMQNSYICSTFPIEPCDGKRKKDLILISPNKSSNKYIEDTSLFCQNKTNIDKQSIIQSKHSDGSIEYQFPNGNIKKIFPDQGITKLIYYNGDIRETNKDGKIKYFYASTQTWHTTMPDGLEILEFADGQVERRSHNGTVEVSFPDGSLRILESDGVEKWTLPDGTLIQILTNGERILTLPNGQREIHTNSHKRREYPDGTIKLIYLDGTQETRYSNGRIRLKDKDGNLLMDSYQ
ncbi:PREDICTED: centromere protein J [Eufriesea mexicana]|uniref:centromere protein J n=1 Tax=Eufriesea mexicana TaxID=516756 RepID=UPI00083C847B|nr:PREDICTED: centromere protein J [Eufriesea mexicana]